MTCRFSLNSQSSIGLNRRKFLFAVTATVRYTTRCGSGRCGRTVFLNDVAEAIGVCSSKTGDIDGSQVYDYFLAGRHEEIALYCMRDVECTREVYYCINFEKAPQFESYRITETAKAFSATAAMTLIA